MIFLQKQFNLRKTSTDITFNFLDSTIPVIRIWIKICSSVKIVTFQNNYAYQTQYVTYVWLNYNTNDGKRKIFVNLFSDLVLFHFYRKHSAVELILLYSSV
jgi:hypothetical protein